MPRNAYVNHSCFQQAIKSGLLAGQPPEDNQVVTTMDRLFLYSLLMSTAYSACHWNSYQHSRSIARAKFVQSAYVKRRCIKRMMLCRVELSGRKSEK